MQSRYQRLITRLVADELLSVAVASQALMQACAQGISFVSYLTQQELVSASLLAQVIAQQFALPLFDLDTYTQEPSILALLSEKLIHKHRVLPLWQKERQLAIALADPTDLAALAEIKFHTALQIQILVVEENKLDQYLKRLLVTENSNKLTINTLLEAQKTLITASDQNNDAVYGDVEDAPVVRYVQSLLQMAIDKGASDIHCEPYEQQFRIRLRVDGVLYVVATLPSDLAHRISARLKILAQLDIAERRIPQDGRFKMLSKQHSIDFRVSTCPTVHGEKIVVRILDPLNTALTIESLGFELQQQIVFQTALAQPQGMILVTGPTGSGKTVTLYAALNKLNINEVNISTVEDPVEIYLHGINQVNINLKTGLTFATVLRAFLRQDPDIIMVGEMRDLETAETGIKAAQTGHLVLSTLHTNSAPETLSRLTNMGVPGYNLATSVSLIMAQRLVRRLCTYCKKLITLPEQELLRVGFILTELIDLKIFAPQGCSECTQGYKGRIGIFEVLPISLTIGEILMRGGNVLELAAQAQREGMQYLRSAGLSKVKQGVTSLAEVNRVIKE